ncbi:MAG: hypothetical protein AAF485_25570, partial [Chloroflexota bacterium]
RIAIAQATPLTNGYTWFTSTLLLPENVARLQTVGVQLSITVAFLALALVLVTSSLNHKREFIVALNLSLIIMMLFSPLLRSHEVSAFQEEIFQNGATEAEETAVQEHTERFESTQDEAESWDPHLNPLAQNNVLDPASSVNLGVTAVETAQVEDPEIDLEDTDEDGLINALEIWIDSDINDVDTDNDGLTDGTEYHTLGTDAASEDSDGDSIPDLAEVEGFFYNGQQWYLNPLKADTNNDGLPDSQECEPLSLLSNNNAGVCPDFDGDGEPDVFDFDNDNDNVPDKIDASPYQSLGDSNDYFDKDDPFSFSIDNLTADEPALVQFQLRPVNEEQLYYSGSILDWPTYDLEGQIQRREHSTFANTPNQAIRINAPNASNGDVVVTPKLEISVPQDSTYFGNLPVRDVMTDTVDIQGWLNFAELEPLGVSVQQSNEEGDLKVYVPLNTVEDQESGQIVALAGQTLYWPTVSGWGPDHEVRVVWMVQAIVNDAHEAPDEARVIHIYEDEAWTLTGLDVREDHGFEIALIAEDPAVDPDLDQDDDILDLAANLSLSFAEGVDCTLGIDPLEECTFSNERMTIGDIYDRFNHPTNGAATDGERWFMSDTFIVDPHSYDHIGYIAHVAMTDTVDFLGNVYGNKTDRNPVLIFAREETSRRTNLDFVDGALNPDSGLKLDLAGQVPVTAASLQVAAFRHLAEQSGPNPNSNWQAFPLEEYLVYLGEKLADHPDFLPEDPNDPESVDIADGKIMVAQIYFMSLNAGVVNIVEVDNEPWQAVEELYTERAYRPHSTTAWSSLGGSLLYELAYYKLWGKMPGAASSGSSFHTGTLFERLNKFYKYVKTAGG